MNQLMRDYSTLHLAQATEQGVLFKTGHPVTFVYIRNTEKAPRPQRGLPDMFQQRIEPAGHYMLVAYDPQHAPPSKWETGTIHFVSPLVLEHGGRYDDQSWKARLSRYFKARGATLSAKLRHAGFDAVITVDALGTTSEIVALPR